MRLKRLADAAGVAVFRCEREWGGTYAYKELDHPNVSYCGYRTEAELYRTWAEDKFGKRTTAALIELLRGNL